MKNGLAVARFLEGHKLVKKVLHPGLKSHPQHHIALEQSTGFSGMVCATINGDGADAAFFIKNLKIFALAESLGGIESLVEIPSLMTHASVPKDLRAQLGIDDSLVRLSVGVEDAADLVEDLRQALDALDQQLAAR